MKRKHETNLIMAGRGDRLSALDSWKRKGLQEYCKPFFIISNIHQLNTKSISSVSLVSLPPSPPPTLYNEEKRDCFIFPVYGERKKKAE
jgi:hypothetical protein